MMAKADKGYPVNVHVFDNVSSLFGSGHKAKLDRKNMLTFNSSKHVVCTGAYKTKLD
jgi:hypothetical protein